MFITEKDYLKAKKRLEEDIRMIEDQHIKMKKAGITGRQIKLALDPLISFSFKLKEDIESFEIYKKI